jgi:hypothetical protein
VKTSGHSSTLSETNLANSDNLKQSETVDKISGLIEDDSSSSNELIDDQKGIINDATKDIFDEIHRLKAKYGYLLTSSNDKNGALINLKYSEIADDDYLDANTNIDDKDKEYAALVKKMNDAAKTLLLLRAKLATEYKIKEEELQMNEDEEKVKTKTQEKWSKVDRLMTILTSIESFMEKDGENKQNEERALDHDDEMLKLIAFETLQNKNQIATENAGYGGETQTKDKLTSNGLFKEKPSERDWHSKSCARFKAPCLGWFQDCCEYGQIRKIDFKMCCSFSNNNLKGKDNLSGICIPNPYGNGECVKQRPSA